jgi:hypothetical protein
VNFKTTFSFIEEPIYKRAIRQRSLSLIHLKVMGGDGQSKYKNLLSKPKKGFDESKATMEYEKA